MLILHFRCEKTLLRGLDAPEGLYAGGNDQTLRRCVGIFFGGEVFPMLGRELVVLRGTVHDGQYRNGLHKDSVQFTVGLC